MNCNCLIDIKETLKESMDFKKPVQEVEIMDIGFICGKKLEAYTITHIELTLEGQKKKKEIKMMHAFCPFCGKSQWSEDNKATDI